MVCEGNWYHFFVVKSTFDLYFSPLTYVQQKCSSFFLSFLQDQQIADEEQLYSFTERQHNLLAIELLCLRLFLITQFYFILFYQFP